MITQVAKNAFVIFYSGDRAKAKILKICDAFNANRYPFPEDVARQLHAVQEVRSWKCDLLIFFDEILSSISKFRYSPELLSEGSEDANR